MTTSHLRALFDRHLDRYLAEWQEFLRFPSIGTQPEHDRDCRDCAQWLCTHLRRIGFVSRLLETSGTPVVFAERQGRPGRPVVLYYGHYDVQPVDPLDAWLTPPFTPSLREGRLYARGAEDNKGQMFYVLKAMEALIQADALHVGLKIVIEGGEESGSHAISAALPGWRDLLAADILAVSDVNAGPGGAASVVMGLRGIVGLTVTLSGPSHDLHSGVHGGLAPNPATAMARLLATLHDPDGHVAVANFYDGVQEPTAKEREVALGAGFDAARYEAQTGVPPAGGELAFGPIERSSFRPTVEVNGIHSGYGGPGSKTIIPATAMAKLTARLVPRQNPEACLAALVRHIEAQAPPGLRLELSEVKSSGPGLRLDPESPLAEKARTILDELTGRPTVYAWEGGSIPVVAALTALCGAAPLLVGFGREEDRCHAPNESFSIDQFRMGYLFYGRLLGELSAE